MIKPFARAALIAAVALPGAVPARAQADGWSCGGLFCDIGVLGHKTAPPAEMAPPPAPAPAATASVAPAPAPVPRVHRPRRIARAAAPPHRRLAAAPAAPGPVVPLAAAAAAPAAAAPKKATVVILNPYTSPNPVPLTFRSVDPRF